MKLGFSYKFLFYLLLIVVLAYIVLNYLGNFGIKTAQEGYFNKGPVAIGNFGPNPKNLQEGYFDKDPVAIGNFGPNPKNLQEGYNEKGFVNSLNNTSQKTVNVLQKTGNQIAHSDANPLNW